MAIKRMRMRDVILIFCVSGGKLSSVKSLMEFGGDDNPKRLDFRLDHGYWQRPQNVRECRQRRASESHMNLTL